MLSRVIVFGTCKSVTLPHILDKVRLDSSTSISTSSFPVSSVIVTLELHALIFLNSKSTPVFCLNTHTQAVHTFEAVFASQPPPHEPFEAAVIRHCASTVISALV
jgi:hypothetical protein